MGVMTEPRPLDDESSQYQKGVKHLSESGIHKLPEKYILPVQDRAGTMSEAGSNPMKDNLRLPVVDFAELRGPNRSTALKSMADACEQYGFFQVINHGVPTEVVRSMIDVSTRFFDLPYEERAKYMSSDMFSPVRYGTSLNQNKDKVFCWRDFLKLTCHPMPEVQPHWPSAPADLRTLVAAYAKETKSLFLTLTEAILEGLGLNSTSEIKKTGEEEGGVECNVMEKFEEGSQLIVINCYPPCPEPDLTLGMPPHSDYGFLTLLLQDEVEGLQIRFKDRWVMVEPIPDAFVINVGDHLEIFSNGRYKSVLHRVLANSARSRISVASLHSLPYGCSVRPSPGLVDKANPQRYKDTDFASFLEYISSCEPKRKNFLESRKLT